MVCSELASHVIIELAFYGIGIFVIIGLFGIYALVILGLLGIYSFGVLYEMSYYAPKAYKRIANEHSKKLQFVI
jgi:hypothetical protein